MESKKFLFNGDLSLFSEKNGFDGWVWTTEGDYVMSRTEGREGRNAITVNYVGYTHPHSILNLTNTDEAREALANKIKAEKSFGMFSLSCYFKSADEASLGKKIIIKTHYIYTDKEGNQVGRVDKTAPEVALTNEWVKAYFEFPVGEYVEDKSPEKALKYVAVEFIVDQNLPITVSIADIEFNCIKVLDEQNFKPRHQLLPHQKTLIGAIRWDVWDKSHSANEINQIIAEDEEYNKQNGTKRSRITAADMMMRTLSYYPWRAPYFVEYEGEQDNGDVKMSIKSCYEKTGLTYQYEDVMDDLKIKQHPYIYGVSWEEEATMAMDAGIDYFAYLYKSFSNNVNNDQVLEPSFAHTATNGMLPDGRQMKMVCIMQYNHAGIVDLDTLKTDEEKMAAIIYPRRMIYKAMAQSCYLNAHTTNGDVPIMHFYTDEYMAIKTPDILPRYVKEAKFYTEYLHKKNPDKYRVVDDIYFVAYAGGRVSGKAYADCLYCNYIGYDAVSRYAVPGIVEYPKKVETAKIIDEQFDNLHSKAEEKEVENVIPKDWGYEWSRVHRIENCYDTKPSIWKVAYGEKYSEFIKRVKKENRLYLTSADFMDFVPCVGLGYNVMPRVKTRVLWCNDYGCMYLATGTAKEQAQQLKDTLEFMLEYKKANPNTANMIDLYAWNEFDEGGYLQPTIAVDKNGKPVRNEDGIIKKNTDIIDECAKVIKEFREKEKACK